MGAVPAMGDLLAIDHAVCKLAGPRLQPCSLSWTSNSGWRRKASEQALRTSFPEQVGVELRHGSAAPRCSLRTSGSSSKPVTKPSGGSRSIFGAKPLVIREAMPEEYWEVADLHCAAFFAGTAFPMDLILRSDRVFALLANLGMPQGVLKKCLVALEDPEPAAAAPFTSEEAIAGGPLVRPLVASLSVGLPQWPLPGLNLGPRQIAGTVTVDNAGEFLLRRQPGRRRRQGTAYISNMAVRSVRRRRGVARQLLQAAEEVARSWGCTSAALHCDASNKAASMLYFQEGYRLVLPPPKAKWPQPWAGPDVRLALLMKTLVQRDGWPAIKRSHPARQSVGSK